MEENEVQEDSKWDIELVINLFGQTFYFPLLFGFIFVGFCKYLFIYIYLYTELDIEQTKNFV